MLLGFVIFISSAISLLIVAGVIYLIKRYDKYFKTSRGVEKVRGV